MFETNKRSLRLLIDLQACQTQGSAQRGVGRYSQSLFDHILKCRGERDIFCLASNDLPYKANLDTISEARVLRVPNMPEWGSVRGHQGGERDYLDALAYSAFVSPTKSDIVHVSHVFEGFGDRIALPSTALRPTGQLFSATLYDLIPLLYQEHYFQNDDFRKWYLSRMDWLRKADLLLAISESSRQDAINLLGIEPWRITTIHGGIAPHFKLGNNLEEERRSLLKRYGLRKRFVLYTGGDDYRKNIKGAIAGYAEIPKEFRQDCQLVIVCSMDNQRKQMYLDTAQACGLALEDVLITGFVPEEDLVSFYRTCDAFVFPSLYEGLGLPVMEAMACGAPVIGGNNSSVREIISREDAMFDASTAKSIGEAISNVLRNKDFSNSLREYGLKRIKDFSWQQSASKAIAAFDEALQRNRVNGSRAAVHGWIPRKRIAILTPLPPCRSGIADYNAKFLPYLAQHFDIDLYVDNYSVSDESLAVTYRIFDAMDFEAVAKSYDAILYEFGNSEFHDHMLPLLAKFPGIVGLHDAYLSGLMMYLEYYKGEQGRYEKEMLDAHAPLANRFFAPVQKCEDPLGKTIIDLPCTKRILDQALGVISHSPFNLEVARKFYPEGWQAPYRIIPQMVSLPVEWSIKEKMKARNQLGFNDDDFVIATFGHVVWTKLGERLLEAFLSSALRNNSKVHLIYAGELASDDFGQQLKNTIANAKLGKRIQITGFLREKDFENYLRVADVAVQLRTNSRGGTPKGVLDCLASGLPVIVNNEASYTDYPDDVVIKIDAEPTIKVISAALENCFKDAKLRASYSKAGKRYVQERHDPSQCAAEYAAAIHEFMARENMLSLNNISSKFAPHLGGCSEPSLAANAAIEWFSQIQMPVFTKPRLIIDVSHIAKLDHQTGIQRVVKQIVQALYCSSRPGFDPLAVELVDRELHVATPWLLKQGLISLQSESAQNPSALVEIQEGDVLLMLDSSWERYKEFYPVFSEARARRVPILTVVYDLLPITLPPGNFVDGGKEWFQGWVNEAVSASDGLICISKAVADDVGSYLENQPELTYKPKVGYWHLGSDFSTGLHDGGIPSSQVAAVTSHAYLLMVGTIEPRKNHALALESMERLWAQGHELCLCIVGKEGWMVSELVVRLRNHPLLGKKLFLFEGTSDTDMALLYEKASGLLFMSKGEGFGLPLVEAANRGIPIVCSDIPIFHEIAGEYATYVALEDAASVAKDLETWWNKKISGRLPKSIDMPRLSWEQSSEALLDVVFNKNWIGGTE